jgi:DNA-binding NtrC family response regulator
VSSAERTAKSHRPTVLVVDNNYYLLDFLRQSFADLGLKVHAAKSGAEARSILAAVPVDLAFIAVMLSDEDGVALADFAAEHGIKIVLMSGHPEGVSRGTASKYKFLQKPFHLKDAVRVAVLKLPNWKHG